VLAKGHGKAEPLANFITNFILIKFLVLKLDQKKREGNDGIDSKIVTWQVVSYHRGH